MELLKLLTSRKDNRNEEREKEKLHRFHIMFVSWSPPGIVIQQHQHPYTKRNHGTVFSGKPEKYHFLIKMKKFAYHPE